MFVLSTAVYAVTRFWGLTRFPIYFFCDEAVQSTLANGLLHNGFRSSDGVFLPPFLRNDTRFNLSLSVYLQVPATALFGTTVAATRGTSVVVGFAAIAGLVVIARVGFGLRTWWVAPLVLASIPAWFLHSRTAFEVAITVPMYACFLGAYLLYRYRSPRYAPLAVILGAATFYSYANGQGLMMITTILLVISDFSYHREHLRPRRVWGPVAAVAVLAALPYLRERRLHPSSFSSHLRSLDSYWYRDGSLGHKLWTFLRTYAAGLDPRYWFTTHNTVDLSRHIMRGMGHVWWPLAPFILVGLVTCVQRWRSSAHRLVIIAVLASPFSAALVEVQITRALPMVVPIAVLTMLGLDRLLGVATQRAVYRGIAGLIAFALAMLSLGMTSTALANGARWYSDYGLYGMQWGAGQVFPQLDRLLAEQPNLHIVLSTDWANNPNAFIDFFIAAPNRPRIRLENVDDYLLHKMQLDPATLFVLTPTDLERAEASNKLMVSPAARVIRWPDGRAGFIFTHLQYVPGVDALFAADEAKRRQPVLETVTLDGEPVTVTHSLLDIGTAADIFDGDSYTLIRGFDANPFLLELTYPGDRLISSIRLTTRKMDYRLVIELLGADGGVVARMDKTYRGLPTDPTVVVDVSGAPVKARSVRLQLTELGGQDITHIHIRELVVS